MVLQSSGAISLSQIAAEFGGTAPHAMSEYYSDNASGYTAGISGIPATGSAFPFSSMYGKAKTVMYTLQHPDGRSVLWDTNGDTLRLTPSGTTLPLQFSIYNNASVYESISSFVGLLYNNTQTRVLRWFGGFLYNQLIASYPANEPQYAFRFRLQPSTNRYIIEIFSGSAFSYVGYNTTSDYVTHGSVSNAIAWTVTPSPTPVGPNYL